MTPDRPAPPPRDRTVTVVTILLAGSIAIAGWSLTADAAVSTPNGQHVTAPVAPIAGSEQRLELVHGSPIGRPHDAIARQLWFPSPVRPEARGPTAD
jgi:hypothetical protein